MNLEKREHLSTVFVPAENERSGVIVPEKMYQKLWAGHLVGRDVTGQNGRIGQFMNWSNPVEKNLISELVDFSTGRQQNWSTS